MLFVDVRGSTTLAERMSPYKFSRLVNRLVGDQVIGLFIPGFAGSNHARLAVEAAYELLTKMGHEELDAPLLPIGAGVHTDIAFVDAVG